MNQEKNSTLQIISNKININKKTRTKFKGKVN